MISHVDIQLSQHHLLKKTILPKRDCLRTLMEKPIDYICKGLFSPSYNIDLRVYSYATTTLS